MTEALEPAAVVDIDIERLVQLDRRIDQHESTAIRERWEFGHGMLAAREGKRLPNRFITKLMGRTGKSRAELGFRIQFAATYQTEQELSTAVDSFSSWTELRASLKLAKDAADNIPVRPLTPPLEGECATFVVDPPWQYGNTSTRGAAENHYQTMSIKELCDLDTVPDHAADQAHLYLWTTAGHLPQAFDVMDAWGFEYKTYLVWVKPQMGMGNYFRVSTELVLFGVKGALRTLDRGLMNWFEVPRGKHSQKPADFYDLVMKASPGPYGELFNRCYKTTTLHCVCSGCRLGWKTWGDQA